MNSRWVLPSVDQVIRLNEAISAAMPDADEHAVWDRPKLEEALRATAARGTEPRIDAFDLAAELAAQLVKAVPFGDANHRTVHVLVHQLLERNGVGHAALREDEELRDLIYQLESRKVSVDQVAAILRNR